MTQNKKLIYIAHPLRGNKQGNLDNIARIAWTLHKHFTDVVPFVPYFLDASILNDDIPAERRLGMNNGKLVFKRCTIDEIWVFGEHISDGVYQEISHGLKFHIPVKIATARMRHKLGLSDPYLKSLDQIKTTVQTGHALSHNS